MDEESYSDLISENEAAYEARLKIALDEIGKGEVQSHKTVNDLMAAIESVEN